MRRTLSRFVMILGIVLVQGGKVLAGLAALALAVLGVVKIVEGHAVGVLAIFPGAPAIAGIVNVAISLPGGVLMTYADWLLRGEREELEQAFADERREA